MPGLFLEFSHSLHDDLGVEALTFDKVSELKSYLYLYIRYVTLGKVIGTIWRLSRLD